MRTASAVLSRPRAPGQVQLWWQLARRSFLRSATYRAATFAGVFTNTVFGFLRVYVLLAVLDARPGTGGFDAKDAVTFTFVTQGLLAVSFAFAESDIAVRIRTGDVVSDLYRPVDFQAYWFANELGRIAFQLVFRGVPPLLIASFVFDVRVPPNLGVWVAFVVSVWLGATISFAIRYATSLSGFWLLDARGVWQITSVVSMFFAGIAVPLSFLPDGLVGAARWLPFAGMAQLPTELFLGKHHSAAAVFALLARQAGWAVLLLAVGRVVGTKAFRKVVVQGG
jgi:ABC-2 type transport system permease protein